MTQIRKYTVFSLFIAVGFLLSLMGCNKNPTVSASWFDADGVLLRTEVIDQDCNPTLEPLPQDTDQWHYTGWSVSRSGNIIVLTAMRVGRTKVSWFNFDGVLLQEMFFTDEEEEPSFALPQSTDRWSYTEWKTERNQNEISHTAQREPNTSYFCGNMFQVVVKDSMGKPTGTGSGFIVNDQGWFITNYHVMDGCSSAIAFFDIKNEEAGAQYTQLSVVGGVYADKEKDIFIGKLAGYEKISSHYKEIPFTEEYSKEQKCYSVGYPNSSVKIEINGGMITEEYSDIYSKINGIYYVLSDSYIAPGSSGGILINEAFEVIGITSVGFYADTDKNVYISGGSIPTLVFKSQLNNLSEGDLKTLKTLFGG